MTQRTTQRSRSGRGESGALALEQHRTMGRWLRRLARVVRHLELESLEESGVTRAQGHALLTIQHMARPSMSMLAGEMGLAPSTVTRLVDPLVRRGLVSREPSPDDRRVISLELTTQGKRILRKLEQNFSIAYGRVAAAIPRAEQGRMLEAIRTLHAAIEQARLATG